MATIEELQTSWNNLGQALGDACSGVNGGGCTGALGRHAQLSGRISAWNRLPAESAGYVAIIGSLDQASQQLAGGASSGALVSAGQAMSQVQTLLDNA
jgi:hypothetical protein